MRRLRLTALIIFFLGFLVLSSVYARKKLVRIQAPVPVDTFWNKLKLRSDHQALLLLLGGVEYVSSVSYQLTYTADGVPQAIEGSHDVALGNTQKELVFGTCSGLDCIALNNITDMQFTLEIGLKDGQTMRKVYKITP